MTSVFLFPSFLFLGHLYHFLSSSFFMIFFSFFYCCNNVLSFLIISNLLTIVTFIVILSKRKNMFFHYIFIYLSFNLYKHLSRYIWEWYLFLSIKTDLTIDKFHTIQRGWRKTTFTLWKAFRSYKSSSVTKWVRFTQLFRFLSNINCLEQFKRINQAEKKKTKHFFLRSLNYVINCCMWHHL